jgi:hypothetical protein
VMQVNWGNLIGDASDIFHMFRRRKSFAVLWFQRFNSSWT